MSEPNNGVVVRCFRLFVVDEPGEPSIVREVASAAVAMTTALLGGGSDLEPRSFRLRVNDDETGAVVAEREFRKRRAAEAARDEAVAHYAAYRDEGREIDWQALLDAAS